MQMLFTQTRGFSVDNVLRVKLFNELRVQFVELNAGITVNHQYRFARSGKPFAHGLFNGGPTLPGLMLKPRNADFGILIV
ncbi:hypothetical protein D3C75_647150 [compost metagenome]